MAWGTSPFGTSYWGGGPATAPELFTTQTTTVELVRDGMITAIEALTPTQFAGQKFRVNRAVIDFEGWADEHANASFRRFLVSDLGGYELPDISDHVIETLHANLRVLVAYPKNLAAKWGAEGQRDLYDLMREDMHQIDGAIGHRGGGNYVTGQHGTVAIDKSFLELENTIFLDLTYDTYFHRTAT